MQKIETGGTSRTSTPIFKYLTNVALLVSDARHITHCAAVDSASSTMKAATITAARAQRNNFVPLNISRCANDSPQAPPRAASNVTPSIENYRGRKPATDKYK